MTSLLLLSLLAPLVCEGRLLVGGLADIKLDPSDPNVQFAVGAINDHYTQLGDNAQRTLAEVIRAQSQVVAGTMYYLTLKVTTGTQEEVCNVEIWSRSWLSGPEATQLNKDPVCKTVSVFIRSPLATVVPTGGEMPIALNDPNVQKALDFGVTTLNSQENSLFLRKVVHIDQVSSQVVSGMLYHFRGVHMAATNCNKAGTHILDECTVAQSADTRICDFDVWWQSWMIPEYKLINVSCQ